MALIDGSRLITEACVRAGADVFIGYPITPANLLYSYARHRYPTMLAAPDEITTLQWMSGFSAAGRLPVTATSFPGYSLMAESLNMAFMMELPMVVILVQRLGPATGTATCGSQGDLSVVQGTLSGGFSLPTLCISSVQDCWDLSAAAIAASVRLRTPVILLTSKEMIMTVLSFDTSRLKEITPVERIRYSDEGPYFPYRAGEDLVPPFLPVNQNKFQVRLTASTHDARGILQNTAREALDNTRRLQAKLEKNLESYSFYELDEEDGAETLIVSFDVTAQAAREAIQLLRGEGKHVSLLIAKTLLPPPPTYLRLAARYRRVVIAEENLTGQLRTLLYGASGREGLSGVNGIGKMISPNEIVEEVLRLE
jgi:2-oxoglutarate ferredoxin oxidoreductase subunit alpha